MAATPEQEFQKDLDTIRADIAALTDTVGKLATEASKAQAAMAKTARAAGKKAAGIGEEMWDEAMQLGQDTAEAASHAAAAGVSTLEKEIRRNPFTSVLIALGVGFLVGVVGRK
jgi:ElaB/YqjD/DUF883 family membrane-anchored ribosome-binding protein